MAVMESWGNELWDKYSELTSHAHNGIDFLENYVARSAARSRRTTPRTCGGW